jgi:hypothetical protein
MRKLTALGALFLVGSLGVALAAPSANEGLPVPAITTVSHADAAIGRGNGGAEGTGGHTGSRVASWLQGELTQVFFVLVAIGLGVAAFFQRNAGQAVAIFVGAVVVGAFLLAPDQVEAAFQRFYQFVL